MNANQTDELNPLADRLLALAFIGITQTEIWVFTADDGHSLRLRVVAAVLTVIASGALALRRSHPVLGYWMNGPAVIALIAVGFPSDMYQWTNLVATYSIAAYGTPRQAWTALPASVFGVLFYFWRFPFDGGATIAAFAAAMWVVGWLAGRMYGARLSEIQLRDERDWSRQLAASNQAQLTLEEERSRIARELHDIVGHTVNVMVVHAGAGKGAIRDDNETVRQAFETIEATGRSALSELDRVLAILRQDDDHLDLHPPSGIAELPSLAATCADAGLPVELEVSGEADGVPPSVGLATYRIIQEALTNTMKHAHARTARVEVLIDDHHVDLTVVDDGAGPHREVSPGRGLTGMAERAALHDGTLVFGPHAQGGFAVSATLVWEEAS